MSRAAKAVSAPSTARVLPGSPDGAHELLSNASALLRVAVFAAEADAFADEDGAEDLAEYLGIVRRLVDGARGLSPTKEG